MVTKVKHVYQRDNTGCGIACVAMLINETYQSVKDQLKQNKVFCADSDFGTTFNELTDILKSFNLVPMPKPKFKKWSNIPAKIAIASTNYDKSGGVGGIGLFTFVTFMGITYTTQESHVKRLEI